MTYFLTTLQNNHDKFISVTMYRMTQPYQAIIDAHKEAGADYENEVNNIVFLRDVLLFNLERNRLLKNDRELLILLLELLTTSHD